MDDYVRFLREGVGSMRDDDLRKDKITPPCIPSPIWLEIPCRFHVLLSSTEWELERPLRSGPTPRP